MDRTAIAVVAGALVVAAAIYFRPSVNSEIGRFQLAAMPNGAFVVIDSSNGDVDFCTVGFDAGCVTVGPNK